MNVDVRFWIKVNKTDGCWKWRSCKFHNGYGKFWMNGKNRAAHRVSWELTNGLIPDRIYVLHECDNKLCVRPEHLFLGTAFDNTRDMIQKGRDKYRSHSNIGKHYNCGADNPGAKLNVDTVMEIRKRYLNERITIDELSKIYTVSRKTIQDVIFNLTWKD